MKNQSFHVTIIDEIDNDIIFEGNVQTSNRGFAGLWLPRDTYVQIIVSDGELSATTQIATFSNSPTCLTTLQLN
jgi:hypothetical protein